MAVETQHVSRRSPLVKRAAIIASLLLVAAYLFLLQRNIVTQAPSWDESVVAIPSYNLAHHGNMGTPQWSSRGALWAGISSRTYNTLPMGILYLSLPYRFLTQNTLFAGRIAYALWLVVLLWATFTLTRRLTNDLPFAVVASICVAFNYHVFIAATIIRVDLMTAALGMSALALYCLLRHKRLALALLASGTLVVASCSTHPTGVLYVAALGILIVRLDKQALSKKNLMLLLIPVVLGLSCWGFYVAKDPAAAISQLTTDAIGRHRFELRLNPLEALAKEWRGRYSNWYVRPEGLGYFRLVPLVLYAAGIIGVCSTRQLRQNRGIGTMLLFTSAIFLCLLFLDKSRNPAYLVHIEVWYAVLLACWLLHLFRQGGRVRRISLLIAVVGILLQFQSMYRRQVNDTLPRTYAPLMQYLVQNVQPGDTVIGPLAMWFGFGPERPFFDDWTLGLVSGTKPTYIVQGVSDGGYKISLYKVDMLSAVQERLAQYQVVYSRAGGVVYRNPDSRK